ncbi:MAG: xanthine dehydrogenase small subunit [Pseudomonadota bacterium]
MSDKPRTPEIRREIRFLLNGEDVRLSEVAPTDTLLDFLRLNRRLTGTKEGCAEGDCGACTVLVGRLEEGDLRYRPINACIRFLASLDNAHVVTIEYLRGPDGGLHPVQRAMVEYHGAQCGFCTPGIVMSLYALWMEADAPTEDQIETALQGNLCRCTGYAPIVRAGLAAGGDRSADPLAVERAAVVAKLSEWRDGARVEVARDGAAATVPADAADFASLLSENSENTVIAGATDVGLWVTKEFRPIAPALFIGDLPDLQRIERDDGGLIMGAGVSYERAIPALTAMFPHLAEYWSRIGGWQVRSMGTIGGNIANGSPIGDAPPVFIALGAELTLRRGDARRRMPLEEFFIDYGKQDRAAGEFVESVFLPALPDGAKAAAYKISKRREEDISTLALGATLVVKGDRIVEARFSFGGMAGTPKRATAAEAALTSAPFAAESFDAAAEALEADFQPLTDWRATAEYRMTTAKNLLRRFWLEKGAGEPVRLAGASR